MTRFWITALIVCAALAGALCQSPGKPAPRLEPSWARHVIAEDFHTFTAVAADFTGDGRIDVIANGGDEDEDVLFVAPDWKRIVLHRGIKSTHSTIMDVNRDGYPDFVGGLYTPGRVYWLERPKKPLTDPWPFHVIDDERRGGVDGVHGLTVADINRDGLPDLVASSGGPSGGFPNCIVWYQAPNWERHVLADHDAPGAIHYIAIGDVNGDGRLDVATSSKAGNWFAWWEAPPEPTRVWKKHLIAENQVGATNILMVDLNGDGKLDFAASRGHGKGLVWFEAPSWIPHEFGSELVGPHALAIGDVNGDGIPDIVVGAKDSNILAWFENDGKGHLTYHEIYNDQASYDARLIDMDKDRDLDILIAGQDSKNLVWYENRIRTKGKR